MIKRRLSALLAALLLTLGIGAVAASPAFAAWDGCESGYVCMYDGNGGTGIRHSYHGVSGYCTNINDVPNTANSFYNRRNDSKHIQVYSARNCTGTLLCKQSIAVLECESGASDGPFPVGTAATFLESSRRGGGCWCHRNNAESIFFNTG
jgi:hypothetical protein